MRKLSVLLVLALFGACRCEEPPPSAIAPQIFADVCREPQREVGGVLIGGFQDCAVNLGARDISVKIEQKIKITNPSQVELTLVNVELIGDPSYELVSHPDVVAPGFSGEIVIHLRPRTETTIATSLFILSDANNLPQTDESLSLLEIPFVATGVDNGIPDIVVSPLDCDFGRVAMGGVKLCEVTIRNAGNRDLVLDSVDFVAVDPDGDQTVIFDVPPTSTTETPFAFSGQPPRADEPIAGGGEVSLPVRFAPDVLGNYRGRFRVLSSDPDEEQIDVTLGGIGVTPPTCEISVKSVNGVDADEGEIPEIEPLDNVILTIETSTPSTPDGSIASQEWRIIRRPAGSGIVLTNESLADTGFSFDNGDDFGVDLAGEYCVAATVTDDLGTDSVNECTLCFEAIPKDNFLAQLSWDTDGDDIDLHVTKQAANGQYCIANTSGNTDVSGGPFGQECSNGLDCNYATCRSIGPDWDGLASVEGDPTLDIDDVNGFGPENINVDAMTPGFYLVGVNSFRTAGQAGSTVRIFIFGRLAGEFFFEQGDEQWTDVALVRWPDGVTSTLPCVEDLLDNDANDELDECDAFEAEQAGP